MASKRNLKKYKHLEKRTPHGSWFVDISIVPELRHLYDNKTRLRHSLKTCIRGLETRRAISDLTDLELSLSTVYTNALDQYAGASSDTLDGLADQYEQQHDLHSSSTQSVTNHPTYAALRQLQTGEKRPEAFGETLAEVLKAFLAKRKDLSPNSVRSYKTAVSVYGPNVVISQIMLSDVNHWVDNTTGAKASIKSKLSRLSSLWDYCRNRGLVDENMRNPFQGLDVSDRTASKPTELMEPELLNLIMELSPSDAHRDFWRVV